MKLKIAFDIGGVISKYPAIVQQLMLALQERHEVYALTDQHDRESVLRQLTENGFGFIPPERVFNADYDTYGERCKAVICEREGFDVLMDDFPGYLAGDGGAALRLLVQPDPYRPYYAPEWKGTPDEGKFGRRVAPSREVERQAVHTLEHIKRKVLMAYLARLKNAVQQSGWSQVDRYEAISLQLLGLDYELPGLLAAAESLRRDKLLDPADPLLPAQIAFRLTAKAIEQGKADGRLPLEESPPAGVSTSPPRACIVLSELEHILLTTLARPGQNFINTRTPLVEAAVERLVRFHLISEWITEYGQRRLASNYRYTPEDRIEYSLTDEGRAVLAACEKQI